MILFILFLQSVSLALYSESELIFFSKPHSLPFPFFHALNTPHITLGISQLCHDISYFQLQDTNKTQYISSFSFIKV